MNLVALFLNWLDLREPAVWDPSATWLLRAPTAAEQATFSHWRSDLHAWDQAGSFCPKDLGRGCVAGTRVIDLLRRLEAQAADLLKDVAPFTHGAFD